MFRENIGCDPHSKANIVYINDAKLISIPFHLSQILLKLKPQLKQHSNNPHIKIWPNLWIKREVNHLINMWRNRHNLDKVNIKYSLSHLLGYRTKRNMYMYIMKRFFHQQLLWASIDKIPLIKESQIREYRI